MYEQVKVFGERNTGTNFLNLMLDGNGVHANILNKENDFLPAEWALGFDEVHRPFFVERYLDQLDAQEFQRNFGWKHAAVSIERLSRHPLFSKTFFILLVRNPYNFAASLYRRSYNLLPPVTGDRKNFLRSPIIANGRDQLANIYLRNPIDLWTQKTLAAFDMALAAPNACLVRYEDIVRDTVGFIRWLGRMGLVFEHDDIVQVASTKRDPISFAQYRDTALAFDPATEFDAEDLAFLSAQIPDKLAKLLGYGQGRTQFAPVAWENETFSHIAL